MSFKETHNELYKFNNELYSVIYSLPNNIKTSFNNFYNFLLKLDPIKLQIFIDTNIYILKNTRYELCILIKESKHIKPYHSTDPNLLRSMYDKLFIKLLNLNSGNNSTLIFKEFVKGITYFKYQESGYIKDPVYHRLFSCGDGSHSFRNTFNRCSLKKNRKDVSKRIKTCFVERLIYENIYLRYLFVLNNNAYHIKKTQDQGHTNWLKQTNNDFNTCFKGVYIKIKIKYSNLFPIHLMIIWFLNENIIYTEEYIKSLKINGNMEYNRNVSCIKRNKTKTYITKTNFEKTLKFYKKDENNKQFFKLLEKDNFEFRENYAKEYYNLNNNNLPFDFNFELFSLK